MESNLFSQVRIHKKANVDLFSLDASGSKWQKMAIFVKSDLGKNTVRLGRSDAAGLHLEQGFRNYGDEQSTLLHCLKVNQWIMTIGSEEENSRQSPQTRRFFVTWMRDGTGLWMRLNAIASFSLWPQSIDSSVSSSSISRVIHDELNLCSWSISSFVKRSSSS